MHKRLGQQKALSQKYGNDDEMTVKPHPVALHLAACLEMEAGFKYTTLRPLSSLVRGRPSPRGPGPRATAPLALAPEAQPPWPLPQRPGPLGLGLLFSFVRGRRPAPWPWPQSPSPPGLGPRGPAPLGPGPRGPAPWHWPQRPSPLGFGPVLSTIEKSPCWPGN